MIKFNISISLIMLVLSFATNAQDLFVRKGLFSPHETATEKLQSIGNKNTVGGYPIIRIGEEMQLLWSKVNYSTGSDVPLGRVLIFTVIKQKMMASLDMSANLATTNSTGWNDEPCKRDNYLWKRSIGGPFKNVNCTTINHIVNYFVEPKGDFQQIIVAIKDQGIELPPTVIRVTFTRFTSDGRRLVYEVDVNPEQYGLDRDATTPWGSNSWYKDFVKRDPKKVEFLANLTKWAMDAQDRIELAFDKKPNAFENLKSIDEYLTGNKVSQASEKIKISNMEEKLSFVKSAYEKGLLTESQYNDQVRTLLEGLK